MRIPLSASDLEEIAAALRPIETLEAITENALLGDIEVFRPSGDHDSPEVIGHFVRDGLPNGSGEAWYGFVPAADS